VVELGDVIVIDPDAEVRPGDLVAVHVNGKIKTNVFRKYSFGTNGEVFLTPANTAYETLKFSPEAWADQATLIGVMIEVTKPRRT
jgi:SOS-response transcriptional repressor LexA